MTPSRVFTGGAPPPVAPPAPSPASPSAPRGAGGAPDWPRASASPVGGTGGRPPGAYGGTSLGAPGTGSAGPRRRHDVPTHLDVQDRLFLGLSPRQVAYLMLGLVGAVGVWSRWPHLPTTLRLGLALACAGVGAAVGLARWRGHGPEEWALVGLRYAALPRRAVWRPGPAPAAPGGPASSDSSAGDADEPGRPGGRRPGHPLLRPLRALRPSRGRRPGAVQAAFVGLEDIAEATLHLAGSRHRAVLEVTGIDFDLRRADEQEALVSAFGTFLNGLTFPVQVLVRVQPVDLEDYLQRLEGQARRLPHHLAVLAHGHATFLRRLAGRRALLERRCYVVLPADADPPAARRGAPGPRGSRRPRTRPPGSSRPTVDPAGGPEAAGAARQHALAQDAARRQRDFRCAEVARGLARAGLGTRRLDTEDLARLLYAAWCPDLAGVQRLRQRVADYTTPVVCATRPLARPTPSAPPPAGQTAAPGPRDDPWGLPFPPAPGDVDAAGPAGDAGPAGEDDGWRFARGTRGVADLVAPAAVEVAPDHVRIDRQYLRSLAVTGYPRTVTPGWLAPILYARDPLELSLHVRPLASGEMVKALSHKLVQLHSSRLLDARGGRLADPEREVAYDDVERLRDALQRGEERVFATSLYLLLRAPSPERLDEVTRRAEAVLDGMLAQSRVALLEQDGGLRACLPLADDRLLAYRNLDTSSLATTFPFSAGALTMERGAFYGVSRHGHTPVVVDPFDATMENANAAVIATSGAGKSYCAKLVALRHHLLGVDVLVVDPEDEYRRLCAAVGGQYVRLSATSRERLNPFDLPPPPGAPGRPDEPPDESEESRADALAEQVAALVALVEIMVATPEAPLTAQERATLDRALYATYARAGITAQRASQARPAPLLRDLYAVLAGAAPADATAAGLAGRLHRYVEGSLAGLFAGPTNVALDRPFVVFSIQRLEPELRPLAIHLITAFVWGQVRRARRPRLLVVDEAWSVLQYREGGAFLAGLARRARKYHLGLVTISQSVADFLATEAGRAVLANAALKLLMKQEGATIDRLVALFDLTAEERQLLLAAGKGEGLLFARGARVPLQVEASAAEHRLITTSPLEVAALEASPEGAPDPLAPVSDARPPAAWPPTSDP